MLWIECCRHTELSRTCAAPRVTMRSVQKTGLAFCLLSFLLFTYFAYAQVPSGTPYLPGVEGNHTIDGDAKPRISPDKNGKFHISAKGIRAHFVPYGASISNLFIKDKRGIERDIVLGWDNATYYTIDKQHPYYGAVPGRYANRIKNSTFTIDGKTSHILPNENNGEDTLHGGPDGWSWRNWTVIAHTTDSITFFLADQQGDQGFPGEVIAYVTYTVTPHQWHIRMSGIATTEKTPIMLSSHTYWNLDAFQNPNSNNALNHTLHMPYSGQRIATDSTLIPTGEILSIPQYDANDFHSAPKQIGSNLTSPGKPLLGECGTGCNGYDTCFLVNRESMVPYDWRRTKPVATLASEWSGIKVQVYSDQDAFQIYSCDGQDGTLALKKTQGLHNGRPRVVEQYGCVVMEVEDWIDGINNPEWGRDKKQIFGPATGPYTLQAVYKFSADA